MIAIKLAQTMFVGGHWQLARACTTLAGTLNPSKTKEPMPVPPSEGYDAEYDVVVVGGGSAGCIVAARLTENPKISLCLIEAGGRDRNPWIHIPMGFGKLVPNPKMNWGYETEPERGLDGRGFSFCVQPSLQSTTDRCIEIDRLFRARRTDATIERHHGDALRSPFRRQP